MITLAPTLVSSVASVAETAVGSVGRLRSRVPTDSAPETSFSEMMSRLSTEAVETIKAGESSAISSIEGKASIQEVVDAIMSAERTLQTMIAVRDKAVNAYQEISRMAI